MKICDKHGVTAPTSSRWTIIVHQEGTEIELCDECYLEFMEFINDTKKKRGRPKALAKS